MLGRVLPIKTKGWGSFNLVQSWPGPGEPKQGVRNPASIQRRIRLRVQAEAQTVW